MSVAHAVIGGLRRPSDEAQLTQVLASVLQADRRFARRFLHLVLKQAAGRPIDAPEPDLVSAEEVSEAGRFDLRFRAFGLDVILELKIHAGYGRGQLARYLSSLEDVDHAYLIAVTRDVPLYGEPLPGEDERWLGSVRWRELLSGLRQLEPADEELRRQWPLLLDVLELEGSMGFTRPDARLFETWSSMRQATEHVEGFVEAVRVPVLQACIDALAGDVKAADFYRTRGGRPVLSRGRWGKADMPIQVPADGPIRLRAGLFGYNPPTRFYVAPHNGRRWITSLGRLPAEAKAAVTALLDGEFREYDLHAFYELTPERLASPTLEEDVVLWAHARFADVVASGLLACDETLVGRGSRGRSQAAEDEEDLDA